MPDNIHDKKGSNSLMKELNKNTLRFHLRGLTSATLEKLSRVSGVGYDEASLLAEELCASGEFLEEHTGGGRRYSFNAEHRLALVICVLEKNLVSAAVGNLYGEFLEKQTFQANPGTMDFFDGIVERYLAAYPAIGILAFGMAGFEVGRRGPLLTIDFPRLEWVNFRSHFLERYNLASILENEIKAAVLGHYQNGNFGEDKCVAALYVAQTHHSGAAACIDGKIYRGRDNAAGEVIFLDTPVRWRHFNENNDKPDFSGLDMIQYIAGMVVPQIVFLNPDRLVIYGNGLPENTLEDLRGRLLEVIPREFHPELVLVPDIAPDAIDGLVHLALKELKPKIVDLFKNLSF